MNIPFGYNGSHELHTGRYILKNGPKILCIGTWDECEKMKKSNRNWRVTAKIEPIIQWIPKFHGGGMK